MRIESRSKRNRNLKGTSAQVKKRKQWLLDTFGDGMSTYCMFNCGTLLTYATLTVDRYPIPGYLGGTYHKGNIRPACHPCNSDHGGRMSALGARYRW